MTRYRYVFADLLTDRTITELDLSGVSYDRRIIQPGSFRGSVGVPNGEIAERARKIQAGRTVCHVYRDADIWGTYLIWQVVPRSDERGRITLELRGATLESYFYRREIRTNLSFQRQGQLAVARGLIADMQSRLAGHIGLTTPAAQGGDGVLISRAYRRSEAATFGKRLEELASADGGFEYMIRTYLDPDTGRRVRAWTAARPRLGQASSDHVFTQPGDVITWSYPADATQGATSWQTRGDKVQGSTGEGEPLMSDIVESSTLLSQGWPLLDATRDYTSERDRESLNGYARWWAASRSGVIGIPQVTVRLGEQVSFSPNALGDRARLVLVNPWFPLLDRAPTFSKSWRVVGIEVTPVSRQDGQERATLIFEEAS
ncbi:hypothetical protein ACGFNU_01820 [Spirillospora sp. NPDC048911]|uniref:hypothetical protein n=1 Tax=Spirillospora sp. NPDC048911 TaxID=3364527 RepID=UPI003718BB7D